MKASIENLPGLYLAFRTRWEARDERIAVMDAVVSGDWRTVSPDDKDQESRSPNLIQVGLEDTAETAATIPTVRVVPSSGSDLAKTRANAMEQLAASYMDLSKMELLTLKSYLDLCGFGFFVWVVVFDKESGSPMIEWRDPRTCFPEPGWRPGDSIRNCMFARELYVSQLPDEWAEKIRRDMDLTNSVFNAQINFIDRRVTLIETYDEDHITVTAMYQSNARQGVTAGPTWNPVLLDRMETPAGICPVVLGQRPTLDGEPRGQFDQVVGVMQAHIRLTALVLDYADQAVYSDVWVKDLIGQMSYGGGGYINLGPQGDIGRVQPAVSSLTVDKQLDQLVTNVHLGGRWPKSRPGEVDQAIASAKFIEATAGMMNTVIRTMHLVTKRALEQALRIALKIDVELGEERTVAGVLRNQQFLSNRSKGDIDLKARLRVDYGIGLGRDQGQAMVLGIQGMQTGLFSKEFVQENFEGITDVAREQARIDGEKFQDMAFAQLLQGLQDKTIPPQALVDIAKARSNGEDIFVLFEKYIAKPQQALADTMVQGGLPGAAPQLPGADPNAPGGAAPPTPPPPDQLLAGLGGGPGPGGPPQGPPQVMSQLSTPAGGRNSFLSSRTGG